MSFAVTKKNIWCGNDDQKDRMSISTSRENCIRYGSSLRVKDGEVAVFVYKHANGTLQDFIEGPFDQTIKIANFPILSSIVGLAHGDESPFRAEIFCDLALHDRPEI